MVAPVLAVAGLAVLAWSLQSSGLVTGSPAPSISGSGLTVSARAYEIQFKEEGLPPHANWSVALGEIVESGNATKLTFREENGTYSFSATASGYAASRSAENLTVRGKYLQVAIPFTVDPSPRTYIQHVVVIVMENSNLTHILNGGSADAYQAYLYHTYGGAPHYYALCHSSPQNYVTIVSGHTELCQYNSTHSIVLNVTDLPDDLEAHNMSWDGYFESMPTACDSKRTSLYDGGVHNPFVDLVDIDDNKSRCDAHVVNSAAFNESVANGTLPNFSLYVPNQLDDCHSSSQRFCDEWLRSFLAPILNATNATEEKLAQHTAFFVVYDEGDHRAKDAGYNVSGVDTRYCLLTYKVNMTACGGNTYAVAISPYSRGTTFLANATDMDLTSTFEWLLGLPGDGGYDGGVDFPALESLFEFP